MTAFNAVTTTLFIRPVVTMDKLEILDVVQKIDTLDISIRPFKECCNILALDRPKPNLKIHHVKQDEARLHAEAQVELAVAGITITEIKIQADADARCDLIEE